MKPQFRLLRFSCLTPFFSADTATAGGAPAAAEPAAPVAPAAPVEPAAPVAPAPVEPAAPVAPAPVEPAAPAAPVPAEPAAPAPAAPAAAQASAPKKLSIFDRAGSYLQSQSSLVREITDLRSAVSGHVATLAERDQTISSQAAELAELRSGRDTLATTVATLEQSQSTVASGVVDAMAQIGVPQNALPKSQGESESDEAVLAKYESLSGGSRTDYFRANKEVLKRAAAARETARK